MKISIVTPSYNSGSYIGETMESIHNQTYTNFEHIVIDGLSHDDTLNIVKRYPRTRFLSERDRGQSDALNKGFRLTTGEILAWQNADDIYLPGTFDAVVNFFKNNPDIDLVYGYYQLIDSNSNILTNVYTRSWNKWMFIHGRFTPPQPTAFWRRSVFEGVGELNEALSYCMDVDFYSRALARNFNFKRIDQILGQFRIHNESKTQNKSNEQKVFEEHREVLRTNFKYTVIDEVFFWFFKNRSKLAKWIKLSKLVS